jgi:hypothetical protein
MSRGSLLAWPHRFLLIQPVMEKNQSFPEPLRWQRC